MPLPRIVNNVTACEVCVRGRSGHSVVFLSSICAICFKPDGTASRLIALTCTVRVINLKQHGPAQGFVWHRSCTHLLNTWAGGQTSDEAFVNTPAETLGPAAVAHGTWHPTHQIKTASSLTNPHLFDTIAIHSTNAVSLRLHWVSPVSIIPTFILSSVVTHNLALGSAK